MGQGLALCLVAVAFVSAIVLPAVRYVVVVVSLVAATDIDLLGMQVSAGTDSLRRAREEQPLSYYVTNERGGRRV